MPELPEVQCVVNSLVGIKNKVVKKVTIWNNRLREPVQMDLENQLVNKSVTDVVRRGKFLIFKLSKGEIVAHLGMTGKFLIQNHLIEDKFNRVGIEFTDGTFLIYSDIRKFGFVTYEDNANENKYIKKLGIEPLSNDFNPETLYAMTRNNKKNIKQFLLDQSYIVGLGNIYVIELMYICKISPLTKAQDLTKEKATQLVAETKSILEKAIQQGGSSISDYRDAFDQEGSFQDNFNVYGKKFDKLKHPVTKIKQNGRGTYYCAICQNVPEE